MEEIMNFIKYLEEYDGSVGKQTHNIFLNMVYKKAFKHYGILKEEIEEHHSPWNGRLSHGA